MSYPCYNQICTRCGVTFEEWYPEDWCNACRCEGTPSSPETDTPSTTLTSCDACGSSFDSFTDDCWTHDNKVFCSYPCYAPTMMCAMCADDCTLTGIVDGEVLPLCNDACFWRLCEVWDVDGSFTQLSAYDEMMATIFVPAPLYPYSTHEEMQAPLPSLPCYDNLRDILGYAPLLVKPIAKKSRINRLLSAVLSFFA